MVVDYVLWLVYETIMNHVRGYKSSFHSHIFIKNIIIKSVYLTEFYIFKKWCRDDALELLHCCRWLFFWYSKIIQKTRAVRNRESTSTGFHNNDYINYLCIIICIFIDCGRVLYFTSLYVHTTMQCDNALRRNQEFFPLFQNTHLIIMYTHSIKSKVNELP